VTSLASEAHIEGLARYLRSQGVPGSLRELKVVIFFDLTQGRDPRARIHGWDASHAHEPALSPAGASGENLPDANVPRNGHQDPGGESSRSARDNGETGDSDAHTGACRGRPEAADDSREVNEGLAGTGMRGAEGFHGEDFGDSGAGAVGPANDDRDDDEPDVSDVSGGSRPWPLGQPGHCEPGGRAPFPASINLLVPVGSAYGWSSMPGEAGREIIDPRTLRDMIQSASRHRNTRWCVTLVGADGTAVAHGCARGQHAWDPPPDSVSASDANASSTPTSQAGPARHWPDGDRPPGDTNVRWPPGGLSADGPTPAEDPRDAALATRLRDRTPAPAQLHQLEQFLRGLNISFTPVAKGECDHQQAEARYRPSRKLRHLVRARDATCPAPGCGASSFHSDLDHTEHWPHGPTCQCNFGTPCRHHHRTKQAPGWALEQPAPGVFKWTTPTGHIYYTGPTRYYT
jgi:hypothetical protein